MKIGLKPSSPRRTRTKAPYRQTVRINISLPPALDERKDELCIKFSFPAFSDYIQARMRKDLGIELSE